MFVESPFVSFQQALDLAGTLIFVLGSFWVGGRLLWLHRQTGELPELLCGAGMLGTAAIGYPLVLAAFVMRQAAGSADLPSAIAPGIAGWILHDVGVALTIAFTWRVFRPGEAWAARLALGAMSVLAVGLGGLVATGYMATGDARGPFFWAHFAVVWTYPVWGAIESLRYAGLMRRRVALGLADPMTADRFRTWGYALVGTIAATLCASPLLFVSPVEVAASGLLRLTTNVTSVIGVVAIAFYWLAFVPPAWYRERVMERARAAAAEA